MIYLDTHVVVWLYAGLVEKLSQTASDMIEENDLFISPIIILELSYMYESKKISRTPRVIISELQKKIGLKIGEHRYETIVDQTDGLSWTHDPFDRLIVAQAMINRNPLITKDKHILKNCPIAVWN